MQIAIISLFVYFFGVVVGTALGIVANERHGKPDHISAFAFGIMWPFTIPLAIAIAVLNRLFGTPKGR